MKADDKELHTYIVFTLGKKGISQKAIAQASKKTPGMVNHVIRGKRRCKAIESILIMLLGCDSWNDVKKKAHAFQLTVVERLEAL